MKHLENASTLPLLAVRKVLSHLWSYWACHSIIIVLDSYMMSPTGW